MKKRWQLRRVEGQSLVEMALTLPVLLVMFVGLVEIGAALRNYLILVNANREGTRLAARGRWFESEEERQQLFLRVVRAGGIEQYRDGYVPVLRPQDIEEMPANTTIRIYYVQVPDQIDDTGNLVDEDVIISDPWYSGTLHLDKQGIDVEYEAEQARLRNKEFNLNYYLSDPPLLDYPVADNFVIIEIWFDHEQLLKLPIFTEILPEKFTLYAHSTMRVTLDSRIE